MVIIDFELDSMIKSFIKETHWYFEESSKSLNEDLENMKDEKFYLDFYNFLCKRGLLVKPYMINCKIEGTGR